MNNILFPERKSACLEYCAGYSFGMHLGNQSNWASAVVTTVRYIDRCLKECDLPIIVDNGAFPAWRDGKPLGLNEQLDNIWECVEKSGDRLSRIIAPDVIGDARATEARVCGSLGELARFRNRLLVPLQEGYWRTGLVELAREVGAGLFIGGSTKAWKRRCVERVRATSPDIWIHVGRISKEPELSHAAHYRVNAFDTTTFMRKQHRNQAIDWLPRFERFCKRRSA